MTSFSKINRVSAKPKIFNKANVSFLNVLCYFCFFLLISINLINLDYSSSDPRVILAFFLNFFLFCFPLLYKSRKISLLKTTALFNIVFLFIAPLHQYIAKEVFWSNVGLSVNYSATDYLTCNIYIFLIYFVFVFSYFAFSLNPKKSRKEKKKLVISKYWSFSLISLISFLTLLFSKNLYETTNYLPSSFSNFENQIYLIIRVIPIICFVSVFHFGKKNSILRKRTLTFIGIICVILFNPFNGYLARFLLFGVYLSVFYCIFYKKNNIDGIFNFLLLFGFFFFFTSSRHNSSFSWFSTPNFVYVDFDAYQLLMLTNKYINKVGICYGLNFFSAILFLVPRSVISFKLGATGSIFMTYFGSSFNNVSTAFFAECLYAFGGMLSIILIPLVGFLVYKLDFPNYDKMGLFSFSSKCFIFGLSIYICRGSLNASFAYLGAIITSSLLLSLILQNSVKKKGRKIIIIKKLTKV